MKNLIHLKGDLNECAFELGRREKKSFSDVKSKLVKLVYGHEINHVIQTTFNKPIDDIIDEKYLQFIKAYCDGLEVSTTQFIEVLFIFSKSAHYSQLYPQLKSFIPGCLSYMRKTEDDVEHLRIIDFAASAHGGESFQQVLWETPQTKTLLTVSIKGLGPLFLFGLHSGGFSFSIQNKISDDFFKNGKDIFEINFLNLLDSTDINDYKKNLKRFQSQDKWGIILLDHTGEGCHLDISGPTIDSENFHINNHQPKIITNRPIHSSIESTPYSVFCEERENQLKKISQQSQDHSLDQITTVVTASSYGQFMIKLKSGRLDFKSSKTIPTSNDKIISQNLINLADCEFISDKKDTDTKKLSIELFAEAQQEFDMGNHEKAYHLLQMGISTSQTDTSTFEVIQCAWEFKYLFNKNELNEVYQRLKKINTMTQSGILLKQKLLDLFELRLELSLKKNRLSIDLIESKLIYPRLDCMDIFTPKIL